jgi:hypothetical protein
MALRYYIYGEVVFTAAGKRTAAGHRLDQRAAKAGFEPLVWQGLLDAYGTWPAGQGLLTKDGLPALRFCYSTLDAAIATEAVEDISAAWDVFQDSDSFWSYVAQPVP